jgi:hypothetical protein
MAKWVLLVSAVVVLIAGGVSAAALPSRVTCSSLAQPEGQPCPEGRLTFSDQGSFVAIHTDNRTPLRVGLVVTSAVIAIGLLAVREWMADRSYRANSPKS